MNKIIDDAREELLRGYESNIRIHINPHIGGMELHDLRGMHIQIMYNALSDGGLAPKMIKNIVAVLREALDVAVKQAYMTSNPCDSAEPPKRYSMK